MTNPSVPVESEDEEVLPTFSQQVASQLGGIRGMIESSVPVLAFVVVNVIWQLNAALIVAVIVGLGIAGFRLSKREPVRHAINGLFGIAIGAVIAWKTGTPEAFYLPGILLSLAYGLAMAGSIVVRRPLVGWLWSLVADQGGTRWRDDAGLRRTFGWLTALWSATYLIKVVINLAVYLAPGLSSDSKATILGIMRITLGFPPYALLLALTAWAARRHLRAADLAPPATTPAAEPV